ncbi:MAG: NADH-quinone oxidoreductase subunit J [Bacteroidota bacterium]
MTITEVIFYIFSGLMLISALFILFTRNVLYAAFSLVVTLLSVAAIYVLAHAEFLAVTQIMIYFGGIIVLIIFGIMLTNKVGNEALVIKAHNKALGVVIMTGTAVLLVMAVIRINVGMISDGLFTEKWTTTNKLGLGIMTDYILPFELVAILLLIVLIGAISIGGYKRVLKKEKR